MNHSILIRYFRRISLGLACLGLVYLVVRFDIHRLPASGCCPIHRFSPGQALLLDRAPRPPEIGDALLVDGDDGLLYMGLVTEVKDDLVWIETNVPGCPGRGSPEFGWVDKGRVSARILTGLPW